MLARYEWVKKHNKVRTPSLEKKTHGFEFLPLQQIYILVISTGTVFSIYDIWIGFNYGFIRKTFDKVNFVIIS